MYDLCSVGIGVHYGVLGNHDFDFGMDELRKQLNTSTTTWLCTNLVDPRTKRPVAGCEREASENIVLKYLCLLYCDSIRLNNKLVKINLLYFVLM